jgi:DNA-binding NarL/FixJ family response regulator
VKTPRIILADDHEIIAEAIKALLEPEFEVIATASDGLALVDQVQKLKPDVVVADIGMPLMNGLEAGRIIKSKLPAVKIIYLTMNHDDDTLDEAFRIGASAYVFKESAYSELRDAIRKCLIEGSDFNNTVNTQITVEDFRQPWKDSTKTDLTPRQREVLKLLASGRSMKQVAFALDLSTRTVAFHKYRMMEGLKLRSTAELIQFAVRELVV